MDMSHLQGREHFIIPFAVPLFLALAAEVVVWNIGSL
jgi:prepilin peptidase CpaA